MVECRSFNDILKFVATCPIKKVAVACAQDDAVLEAVAVAREKNIAEAILVGDKAKILEIAKEYNIDIEGLEIIDVPDMIEAAKCAVGLVHDGKADMYMKGLIDTKSFLKSVLDKEVGLRTGKALSHIAAFELKNYDKLLFLSDVAFIPYPTLEDKANIIKNSVEIIRACGIETPKVAPLAAVEVVNPKMPATVDAKELTDMCERGEIENCIVDGPLSLDLAIDPEAARHKGAEGRKIVGDADLLIFPDIHAGNITYKTLVHTADPINGNILTGTKAPVILTSRSDTCEVKVNSLAFAALVANNMK